MRVSVVIPVFNEVGTIEEILRRVRSVPLEKEIIIVDDGSSDGTKKRLEQLSQDGDARVIYHERNQGKGAALRTAFESVTGEVVIIQDADLELDPEEYPMLLEPILDGRADVVYGSRFLGGTHRGVRALPLLGNKLLTRLSNLCTRLHLSDMETCYKVFRSEVLRTVTVRSNRFGFEPEFTAKVARRGFRVEEVPISYHGRSYNQGKKISWKDGLTAVFAIFWFRFFD